MRELRSPTVRGEGEEIPPHAVPEFAVVVRRSECIGTLLVEEMHG